jgi:hypothetical protein
MKKSHDINNWLRRLVWPTRIALGALFFAGWYSKCGGPIVVHLAAHHFVIDRQLIFSDLQVAPHSITAMPDGGLVVAGRSGRAWAARTSANGKLLWTYQDPRDDNINAAVNGTSTESGFSGAVSLPNGNILLCGEKSTGDRHTGGFITILDRNSQIIERRTAIPGNSKEWLTASFYRCFPWPDGVVLLGSAQAEGLGRGDLWIMKLDDSGAEQFETLIDFADLRAIVKTTKAHEPSFALTLYNSEKDFNVLRLTPRGEVVAKRTIPGDFYLALHPIQPTSKTTIVTYAERGSVVTLYTLSEQLEDAEPPRNIKPFDATKGLGYAFDDGSIALFGRAGSSALGASAAWIDSTGHAIALTPFPVDYMSYSVEDAVPLSLNKFAVVRQSVSSERDHHGLALSWLTLK